LRLTKVKRGENARKTGKLASTAQYIERRMNPLPVYVTLASSTPIEDMGEVEI